MSARNETISACLGLMDRNEAKFQVNGISFAERRRLVAAGSIKPAMGYILGAAAIAKKIHAPRVTTANYGKCMDVAREYLSIARIKGEIGMLAKLRGVSPSGLSNAIRRIKGVAGRKAA